MNDHQRIAVEHFCLLPEETAHPRFCYTLGTHSVVLTVNAGYE